MTDFEVPKKFGLQQTIGDTVGIGGIFRALRTIPVLEEFAQDIHAVCPAAWVLNYTNPMSVLTGAFLRLGVKTVGLCHSVQVCASTLLKKVGMTDNPAKLQWKIAGINHQGWLLELKDGKRDLYPLIKKRVASSMKRIFAQGGVEKFKQYALEEAEKRKVDLKGNNQLANDLRVAADLTRAPADLPPATRPPSALPSSLTQRPLR